MAGAGGLAGAASPGEGAALTPTEAFTRFVDMKARYQKEAAVNRRNEIMMDRLAVEMEVKLAEVQEERVGRRPSCRSVPCVATPGGEEIRIAVKEGRIDLARR